MNAYKKKLGNYNIVLCFCMEFFLYLYGIFQRGQIFKIIMRHRLKVRPSNTEEGANVLLYMGAGYKYIFEYI
jgi:hypothetical protein